jgi:hypothetical protein
MVLYPLKTAVHPDLRIPEKRVYQKQTDLFSMPQVVSS